MYLFCWQIGSHVIERKKLANWATARLASARIYRNLARDSEAELLSYNAGVAELADALDSKSSDRKIVWVRAPPPAVCLKLSLKRCQEQIYKRAKQGE
jgi:tRNA threonylcarbamoyladenosine modification (KEOPS) complex Cgi121 subunit